MLPNSSRKCFSRREVWNWRLENNVCRGGKETPAGLRFCWLYLSLPYREKLHHLLVAKWAFRLNINLSFWISLNLREHGISGFGACFLVTEASALDTPELSSWSFLWCTDKMGTSSKWGGGMSCKKPSRYFFHGQIPSAGASKPM